MKKFARNRGDREGDNTDRDQALWRSVVETVRPLQRKPRVLVANPPDLIRGSSPSAKIEKASPPAARNQAGPPRLTDPPPLADFDQRHAKRIRSGRVKIDRRVDLHGMRRNQAHAVLRRFLLDCHAQGHRSVLVITGKGGPRRESLENSSGWGRDEPGILRREVPLWLAEPE
jgi:Uncharacterized protein conserved in bacteria